MDRESTSNFKRNRITIILKWSGMVGEDYGPGSPKFGPLPRIVPGEFLFAISNQLYSLPQIIKLSKKIHYFFLFKKFEREIVKVFLSCNGEKIWGKLEFECMHCFIDDHLISFNYLSSYSFGRLHRRKIL